MSESKLPISSLQPSKQQKGITAKAFPNMLERLFKISVVLLAFVILLALLIVVGRSAIYKIHAYERGLHLRGGRFISLDDPGWHVQIPLVDTVLIVKVNERLGYVERVPAMTSDDVTMDVSLQYTYRVSDPMRFALEVDNPERIIFEFVQGKLRDVINTKDMTEVMHSRAELNREVMIALQEKEQQYGVEFVTVQIQSASPPAEVVTAIKDRMVAVQRQEQAMAEAAQRRTLADAEFYAAQKQAEGDAYEITKLAAADADRIQVTSRAQQIAVQDMLSALDQYDDLAVQYIQLLIAQELQENSKWIISGGSEGSTVPRIELPATP
jgi:regulator of protease activity HflC (stomatin/prohibitin superfamily)